MNQSTALSVAPIEKEVSYIPFGSDPADKSSEIRLTVSLIKKFIAVKTKSGAECSDEQALKFVMLCRSRRLNPWEGDCYLVGYDGKDGPQFSLITSHQAFLKRAETHSEFDGMESGVLVKTKDGKITELQGDFYTADETLVGGWAKVHFKTRKWPMYKKLRLEDFRKPFGVWLTNPGGMIVKCAECDALRSAFPTLTGGMFLQQEIEAQVIPATVLPPTQSRLVNRQNTLPQSPDASGATEAPSGVEGRSSAPAAPSSPKVEEPKAKRSGRGASGSPPTAPVQVEPPPAENGAPVQEGLNPFAPNPNAEQPPADVILPIEVHDDPLELATRIRNALRALNMSEQTLIHWAKDKGLMGEKQAYIGSMNHAKLTGIAESWPVVVGEMRKLK